MPSPPQNSSSTDALAQRVAAVRSQIAAAAAEGGRSADCVTLIAVSKGHDTAKIRTAARLGIGDFAENYLQEALPKMAALTVDTVRWHFIGRIQANKTRPVAQHFSWVHGVDRLRIAERLAAQRPHFAAPLQVCIQVNAAADRDKAGVTLEEALPLARAVQSLPRLRLRGFMTTLPETLTDAARGAAFGAMQSLLHAAQAAGLEVDTLSMGMSGDFRAAVRAGATMVRIGTAIFGPRRYPP